MIYTEHSDALSPYKQTRIVTYTLFDPSLIINQ